VGMDSPEPSEHDYRECADEGCPAELCRIYKEGRHNGYAARRVRVGRSRGVRGRVQRRRSRWPVSAIGVGLLGRNSARADHLGDVQVGYLSTFRDGGDHAKSITA